jgi:hypothetical protein
MSFLDPDRSNALDRLPHPRPRRRRFSPSPLTGEGGDGGGQHTNRAKLLARPDRFRTWILLATALLIASCGTPQRPRVEPRPDAPTRPQVAPSVRPSAATSVAYDKFQGNCASLQNYIQARGVQDCDGQMHAGWFGATRCQVTSSGFNFTPLRERGALGRTCLSVEFPRGQMPFKLNSACVRIVDWVPHAPVAQSCAEHRQGWLKQAYDHEQYHVYQCEREVYNGNKRWSASTHRFRACAFTEGGARRQLNNEIEAALGGEHQRIMSNIARESDAFHRTPGGAPVTTRCSLCAGS